MRKTAIKHFLALLKKYGVAVDQAKTIDVGGAQEVYFEGQFIANPLGKLCPNIRYLEEGFSSERIKTSADMIADFLDPQTIVPLRAGYDLVLSFDTLEHVRDPFLFCEHLIAVAKPGAYLFVATVFDWPYHPAPEDYFRFSPAGLRELFENPRNALTGSFSVLYADWDEDKKGVFLVGRRLPENAARLPGKTPDLAKLCATLEKGLPRSTQDILAEFDLLSGHPWAHHASSPVTNYYGCLYGLVAAFAPTRILEVGTAFGMSGATMLAAAPRVDLFVTMDLGIFGKQLGMDQDNTAFARQKIHAWCDKKHIPLSAVRFFKVNTQPGGGTDNDGDLVDAPRWRDVPELLALLAPQSFDVAFVDGKHTEDGLYNDLCSFWEFLRPGGLLVCDDLHEEEDYKGHFVWAGQTLASFRRFVSRSADAIEEWRIWNFPHVLPEGKYGLRPFGLIKKKA